MINKNINHCNMFKNLNKRYKNLKEKKSFFSSSAVFFLNILPGNLCSVNIVQIFIRFTFLFPSSLLYKEIKSKVLLYWIPHVWACSYEPTTSTCFYTFQGKNDKQTLHYNETSKNSERSLWYVVKIGFLWRY